MRPRVRIKIKYLIFCVYLKNCREQYGVHTCDKRRPASYIASTFPDVVLENGFAEDDRLYSQDWRESHKHVAERAEKVLDYIFFEDAVAKEEGPSYEYLHIQSTLSLVYCSVGVAYSTQRVYQRTY